MNQPLKNPMAAVLGITVQGLKEDRAPTSIGYNDFALLFALTQEQLPGTPITAEYLSKYLKQHPAVYCPATALQASQNQLCILLKSLQAYSAPGKKQIFFCFQTAP